MDQVSKVPLEAHMRHPSDRPEDSVEIGLIQPLLPRIPLALALQFQKQQHVNGLIS